MTEVQTVVRNVTDRRVNKCKGRQIEIHYTVPTERRTEPTAKCTDRHMERYIQTKKDIFATGDT
jgi:hypothetical protein